MQLIDTHAHVQFNGFKDDVDAVMQRALDSEVGVINVGTQIDTSKEAIAMLEKYPENVWAVIGLHPEHTYQHRVDEEESHFQSREEDFNYEMYKELAIHPRVVGIGECGLDYYRLDSSSYPSPIHGEGVTTSVVTGEVNEGLIAKIKERQRDAFEQQIRLAIETDKALAVHCRPSVGTVDAYLDVLEMIKPFLRHSERSEESLPGKDPSTPSQDDNNLRFEIHCFTGTLEVAQEFVKLGGYIGLNGIITFDKTGNSEAVVQNIPLENIILETDCPYLTPAPNRGKRNEPAYVKHVAEKIAEWKNISFDEVANQTTHNAKKLFSI